MRRLKKLIRKFLGPFTPKGVYRIIIFYIVNHWLSYPGSFGLKRRMLNSLPQIQLGDNVKVVGPIKTTIPRLIVGHDTWIGKNFYCNGNGSVTIGSNCDIAPEVIFNTGGHKIGDATHRGGDGIIFCQKVGNGCWIGARSTFVNNVEIGSGCVVAACACVTKDFSNNVVIGGVPAKIIKVLD